MRSVLPLLILIGFFPSRRWAQAGEPPVEVETSRRRMRLKPLPEGVSAPVIDGELDDVAWVSAARLGDLRQVYPKLGQPSSCETDVRLIFDGEALYVGFRCSDDKPICATIFQRDMNLKADDHIAIVLDPFKDDRNAYAFLLGAGGALADGLVLRNDSVTNISWDTLWQARSKVTEDGWQGEIRIPVDSIGFDPASTSWGFNLQRNIPNRQEQARWTDMVRSRSTFDVSRAGRLEGIKVRARGPGLEVRPFLVADAVRRRTAAAGGLETEFDSDFELGADVFYRITPSLKLGLSLNTDFAEAEIDQRLVNRTRFPLFLPEKRDFFLEDTEPFYFGPPQTPELDGPSRVGVRNQPDNIPFFTRRIGLNAARSEVPLLVAAKLTGRTQSQSFGILGVRTDREGTLGEQSLFAGRYSRNVLSKSDVGVLVTAGDPTDTGGDATYGVDVNLRTDEFLGDPGRRLRFSAYVLRSDSDLTSGDDLAYHASLSYPNEEVELALEHSVFQDNYAPALGFLLRGGVRKYRADAYWRPILNRTVRQLEFGVTPTLFTTADDDRTQIVDVAVRLLGVLFDSGDEFKLNLLHQRDVLEAPFQIVRGFARSAVPIGAYTYTSLGASIESSKKRPFSGSLAAEAGDYYDGERALIQGTVDWRPSERTAWGLGLEHDRLDLPADEIDVNIARGSFNWALSEDHSLLTIAQYDDVSEQLGVFSRLEWNTQHGGEVFLVFDRGWAYEPHSLIPGDGALTLKLGYTIRL